MSLPNAIVLHQVSTNAAKRRRNMFLILFNKLILTTITMNKVIHITTQIVQMWENNHLEKILIHFN